MYRGLLDHRERMGFAGAAVYDTLILMANHQTGLVTTTAGEIASLFGKSSRTIRRILDELEDGGYIVRNPDLVHGRFTQIRITKFKTASTATNKRLKAEREAAESRALDRARDREIQADMAGPAPAHLMAKVREILKEKGCG